MKKEKYSNGFILGFFIGGIMAIVIYDLVVRGIL
jgi:hypothetical protein